MNSLKVLVFAVLAAVVIGLAGCGGGGGGGSSASDTPAPAAKPVDGVGAVDLSGFSATTKTLTFVATGTFDPTTISGSSLWLGDNMTTGTKLTAAITATAGNDGFSVTPTPRWAFGETYTVNFVGTDDTGKAFSVGSMFTTPAMSCTDVNVWSNPAAFKPEYGDCVALVGVQTIITSERNKVQDDSCALTVGAPLSEACHLYLKNGTIAVADTLAVANGHAVALMTLIGFDDKSLVAVADVNDANNPVILDVYTAPSTIQWTIGNLTGQSTHTADGKNVQLNVGADGKITAQ